MLCSSLFKYSVPPPPHLLFVGWLLMKGVKMSLKMYYSILMATLVSDYGLGQGPASPGERGRVYL